MLKSSLVRTAVLFALSLSLPWAAVPARAESGGDSGTVYRYNSSRLDGSGAGDELLFVSGRRVEVLSKRQSDGDGRLMAFEMDGPGLAPKGVKIWRLSPGGRRMFIGSLESLPAGKAVRVEIFPSGRPAETVAVPVFPWILSNALPALNLAFAGLKDPKGSFSVGVISPSETPNAPPVRSSGAVKVSYVGDEKRGGVPTRKYRLEGEGIGAFLWVHRDEKRLEALEMDAGSPGNSGNPGNAGNPGNNPERFRFQLAGVQALDAPGWEEEKREQLGTPPPSGPVEAVEVKPHPCRVPNYDQDVLCATYPVWENRETKKGRKIGLNVVIVPALGPDKQPDPIFTFGGGPGGGITKDAGWIARAPMRDKRDIVLIDQRGTGRSNPLHCSFYGETADFRRVAGELFPADEVRKCREELEKVADLAQYTTAAFVDDVNEIRQWLGYDRINLNGASYGTEVAQVYWRRYPKTVRSASLIGVTSPTSYNPLGHAAAGQRALDLLLAECASQPECRAAFPDTRADLKRVQERIEEGVTVTVTNTRTGERQEVQPSWGLVAEGIRSLMYGTVAGSLPLQIRKAAEGDLAPIVQMAIERRLSSVEGLDWGLTFSVTCAEDLPFITEEMIRQKTAGTYLGDYRVRQQKAVCQIWPRGQVPENASEMVRSDLPALLISGERDPVTPPESAQEASRYMTNHLHVVVKRGSHGSGGKCLQDLIYKFLDHPWIPGLDPSCVETVHGPVVFMKP